mgnify:CR=1 FL=1|jgi:hypothetical protein
MSLIDRTLIELIDQYCLQHALKYDDAISTIYDARQFAIETDDHLKCELNHKILNELMKNYKKRILDENYTELFTD